MSIQKEKQAQESEQHANDTAFQQTRKAIFAKLAERKPQQK